MKELMRIARYPFLREAAEYIRKEKVDLETLLDDEIYSRARELGKQRALWSIKNPTQPYALPWADEIEAFYALLSYPIARMIISAVREKYAIARFAVAESKNFSHLAEQEEPETLVKIGAELGIEPVSLSETKFAIHFTTFLSYTAQFRGDAEWKLAYQDFARGFVSLSREKFLRIMEEALKRKIERELPLPVNQRIRECFSEEIEEIKRVIEGQRRSFPAEQIGALDENAFPPCMHRILQMIRNGENAPHMARFAIVAFLKGLGLEAEEILKLFATSPDFDMEKSKYQVEHITGKSSHTTYKSPGCATMKSYGLCFAGDDELCKKDWMHHPWVYYRYKKRRLISEGIPKQG